MPEFYQSQSYVLEALNNYGPLTFGKLHEITFIKKDTLTKYLELLRVRGLIKRHHDYDKTKYWIYDLTDASRSRLKYTFGNSFLNPNTRIVQEHMRRAEENGKIWRNKI